MKHKINGNRRGATIRDLAVMMTCLLVAGGLLTSLTGAMRDLSKASVCASNLETLFGGVMSYVNTYNSFPPNNPYPQWETQQVWNGIRMAGMDPSIGFIMTYGLGMEPPARYESGHFKWYVLDQYELPSVCVCPAADYDRLFTLNPEIDLNNVESFVMQYAAFYQTSGTCRSATTLRVVRVSPPTAGGRNAPIPDSTSSYAAQQSDNAQRGLPGVWLLEKQGDPTDPSLGGAERFCWIQAVHPSEVQDPGRVYYLADSRDYRPTGQPNAWPAAATNNGWHAAYGNKVLMGTRHFEYANAMYLDGAVNRDNQTHARPDWNLDYSNGQANSSHWRTSTFADPISLSGIGTQHYIMPVLMVKGWEYFFNADGVAATSDE